jgi:hypothetical protein
MDARWFFYGFFATAIVFIMLDVHAIREAVAPAKVEVSK